MDFFNGLKRKNYSIASRHLEFFIFFIALPVLLILTLFAFFFRRQIIETTKNQHEITLQQYASRINVELQNMSIITSSLIHNTILMDRAMTLVNARTAEQRYLASSEIEKIFRTYLILSRQLVGFYVVFNGVNDPFVLRNYAGINLVREEIETYRAMAELRPGCISFFDELRFSYGQKSGRYITTLAVSPSRENYHAGIRTLIVPFVINPLMDFLRQPGAQDSQNQSSRFLIGMNGAVLASNNTEAAGFDMSMIKQNYKKSWIIIEAPVDISGWTLAEAVNIRSLTMPFNAVLYILYLTMIIILLFFIRYNTFFFARILNPLKLLITKMEAVGNGDFSVRAESGNFIELNKISESFNYMVEKIGILTETIKEEHTERIKNEIEALRYQLNPHFLCNALNAIRMMALITKNDAIEKMSRALMVITEDTLAREDVVYSLEHELYILDNYAYIMKVRYGNTFELIKDVDSSLLKLGVLSMILQPLVENAILHGFNGMSRPGLIVISAALAEPSPATGTSPTLIIDVKDNGNGMSPEILDGIFTNGNLGHRRRPYGGLSRIGLYNVQRRIVLSYGRAYGADVSSCPGEGTVVTLKLPVQKMEQHEGRLEKSDIS